MDNATQHESAELQEQRQFTVIQRRVSNPHQFQFYFDFGASDDGPWAQLGINDMEYVVGYPPQHLRSARRPSPQPTMRPQAVP